MKRRLIKILSGALALIMLCASALGCGNGITDDGGEDVIQRDLMQGFISGVIAERLPDEKYYAALRKVISAVAVKSLSGKENSAVSPLGALYSVSLIANALTDKTQNEIVHTLGDIKIAQLNEYNATYAHMLKKDSGAEIYSSFRINAGKKSLIPDSSFLQLNANYYGADGYLLKFAESDVNALLTEWVSTRLGIQNFSVDAKCTTDTVTLLADTLSFTDSFLLGFSGRETGVFATPNGEKEVSYLLSTETLYASTAKSKGFAKTMKNGGTLVVLSPQGTVTLDQLVQSLDADTLKGCFEGITEKDSFGVKLPAFSFGYSASVTAALKSIGIKALFEGGSTSEAEKTELTVQNALNITSVTLNENGLTTRATAPAAAEVQVDTAGVASETVFSSAFVFIMYDALGVPLTLGTVVDP